MPRLARARFDHCLVTGASAGIGRVFARALAPRARLLTLTARRRERLDALAEELHARHGLECRVIALDLADRRGPERLVDAVREHGVPLDLLVNNAGFGRHGGYEQYPWADWDEMFRLNMTAPAELLYRFWDELRAAPGRGAINVASTAGFQPVPWLAAYAATKAFLRSLTLGLSGELRGTGTRLTSLCPGPTESEFGQVARADWRVQKGRMTAERVVDLALRAYERGRPEVVTGRVNGLVALAASRLPLSLVVPIASRVGRRRSAVTPPAGSR